jgi:hypothetical protein
MAAAAAAATGEVSWQQQQQQQQIDNQSSARFMPHSCSFRTPAVFFAAICAGAGIALQMSTVMRL